MKFIKRHYKRDFQPTSMRIGTVDYVANAVFRFCDQCEDLLIVTSENQTDYGKVAVFMIGDGLCDCDVDYLHGVSHEFIPCGILLACFVVESIENIDTNKLLKPDKT